MNKEKLIELYKLLPKLQQQNLLEVFMRTGSIDPNSSIQDIYNLPLSLQINLLNYVLTDNKNLETFNNLFYQGFRDYKKHPEGSFSTNLPITNDLITAYTKGVVPDLYLLSSTNNPHNNLVSYINKKFPNKKLTYYTTNPKNINTSQEGIETIASEGGRGEMATSYPDLYIDNSGLTNLYGVRNDSLFTKQVDSWDFSGYDPEYAKDSEHIGNLMDKVGTPIPMETPWVPWNEVDKINKQSNPRFESYLKELQKNPDKYNLITSELIKQLTPKKHNGGIINYLNLFK